MQTIRRALLAVVAMLACAVPAFAQTAATASPTEGPSLLWVWVWILVAGVTIFIIVTSSGVNSGRR